MKELGFKETEEQLLGAPNARDNAHARSWVRYRTFIIVFLVTFTVIFAQAYASGFKFANCSPRKLTYEERAAKILSNNPLIGELSGSGIWANISLMTLQMGTTTC